LGDVVSFSIFLVVDFGGSGYFGGSQRVCFGGVILICLFQLSVILSKGVVRYMLVDKMKTVFSRSGFGFLIVCLLCMGLIAAFFFLISSTEIPVDIAGGAYAISPDRRWRAEIWDGYSKRTDKSYAVVYLWDLKKYPSLTEGMYSTMGKKPESKLVFPQDFQARDAKCDVKWTNSEVFSIEFAAKVKGATVVRILEYDISTQGFALRDKEEDTE
jgi:hypothetical protein